MRFHRSRLAFNLLLGSALVGPCILVGVSQASDRKETIEKGLKRTTREPFADKLQGPQIDALVSHLRTFGK